ncbi:MAG: alpha/beta hydrolase [Candidatus Aminicenantes bacterium]|nr:alpha/beta hydrolase [Candidatus Aminicenantes bacterium]
MEQTVFFKSEGLELEALLSRESGDRAVVVTHPHPLYGGEMQNPVVETTARAYQKIGYATLRFNFRGVGSSRGSYDDGKGEGQDVLAAMSYLSDMGFKKIDLAGYSFGAWVNAHTDPGDACYERMVMVSPPVAFMDFSKVSTLPRLALVVAGGRDDIGPPDMIRQSLPGWNPMARFEIIPETDHFYSGAIDALEGVLSKAL